MNRSLERHLLTLNLRLSLTHTYRDPLDNLREIIRHNQIQILNELDIINFEETEVINIIKIIKNSPYYYNSVG